MCLAADVPLVESGTQGYFGQAYVIKKVYIKKKDTLKSQMLSTHNHVGRDRML